jgi:hypothetical protein
LTIALVLPVSADGTAVFEIVGAEAGYRHFGFTAFEGNDVPMPPAALPIATAEFASVRTLPFDDQLQTDTPDEALTFEFVYENILSTYDAIAPRMSNIVDLADAGSVRTFARRILEVTESGLFESARYMPVTRDLSRGKRTLLQRFCRLQLAPLPPTEVPPPAEHLATAPVEPHPSAPGQLRAAPIGEQFDKRALY